MRSLIQRYHISEECHWIDRRREEKVVLPDDITRLLIDDGC